MFPASWLVVRKRTGNRLTLWRTGAHRRHRKSSASGTVGFALYFHTFSTFLAQPGLYLEDLYVRRAHRGKGYDRRLLAHLARIAVERDCGRFEWSVLDWNELAMRSYRRAGAVPMDEWTVWRLASPTRRLADEAD